MFLRNSAFRSFCSEVIFLSRRYFAAGFLGPAATGVSSCTLLGACQVADITHSYVLCNTCVTQASIMICCWILGPQTLISWNFTIKNLPWSVVRCLKNCPSYTEPVVSWPCSQSPVIWLYTERFESSPFLKLFSPGWGLSRADWRNFIALDSFSEDIRFGPLPWYR
jgi:hypothetical protein